jgi:fused signal recognition particle receptor
MFRALYDKIKQGLGRTRDLFSGLATLLRLRGKVDKDFLAELEKSLYLADVGTATTSQIVERVRKAFLDKEVDGDVEAFVKQMLREQLTTGSDINYRPVGPTVILVAGVNGAGKTTSIAKLAYRFKNDGKKVLVAAGDTFRAAAVEQLTIWCDRIGVDLVKNAQGSDPAAVAHDACDRAKARNYDILIVDTAGRLHTQSHLMRELEKIHRVVSKQIDGAPHEVLLVLDGTNGQNAIIQAEQFKKTVKCTGIVLTKLDGTAKGGAIFAIKQKLDLPVKFIGIGEKLDDLEPFDAETYVEALLG